MEQDSLTWEYDAPSNYVDFNNINEEEDHDKLASYFKQEEDGVVEELMDDSKPLFVVDLNTKTSTARKLKKRVERKEQKKPGESCKPPVAKHLRLNASVGLNSSNRSTSNMMSREDREMEEIRMAKEEAARVKQESKNSYKSSNVPPPKREYKGKITQVSEFKFATDKRIKSHDMVTRAEKSAELSFDRNLRSSKVTQYTPKITVPKPFNFDQNNSRKRKMNDQAGSSTSAAGKYISQAKAIEDFHSKTPARFRVASRLNPGVIPKGPMKAMTTTHPQTPNFVKRTRAQVHIESQQEKDEKELEEIKKYKFQAKPVNKAVLSGPSKLKEVEKKGPTKPIGFNFASDKLEPKTDKGHRTPVKVFKARAVPTGIFDGVKGLQEKQHIPATKPQSPKFACKGRVRAVEPVEEVPTIPKFYKPAPTTTGVVFAKEKPRSVTKPVPFNFDASDRERFSQKEKRVQEALEEERKLASSFKARPLPNPSPSKLPDVLKLQPTKPQPFKMAMEQRCESRLKLTEQQKEEQEKEEREKRLFKANTSYDKILHGEGWKPHLEHKATEPMEFELNSTTRAHKRGEYDEYRRQLDDECKMREQMDQEQREIEEADTVKELRKQRETHAKPIRNYKKFDVTKSDKNLTIPQGPNFSDRFKK